MRLFGALSSLTDTGDVALPETDQEINHRYLAAARTSLDEAAFATAWEAGQALPTDQAIAEALTENESDEPRRPLAARPSLTARENEALRLLAEGLTDRQIADTLFVSPRTVNDHVTNLLTKLALPSRTAAAAYALRHGLA